MQLSSSYPLINKSMPLNPGGPATAKFKKDKRQHADSIHFSCKPPIEPIKLQDLFPTTVYRADPFIERKRQIKALIEPKSQTEVGFKKNWRDALKHGTCIELAPTKEQAECLEINTPLTLWALKDNEDWRTEIGRYYKTKRGNYYLEISRQGLLQIETVNNLDTKEPIVASSQWRRRHQAFTENELKTQLKLALGHWEDPGSQEADEDLKSFLERDDVKPEPPGRLERDDAKPVPLGRHYLETLNACGYLQFHTEPLREPSGLWNYFAEYCPRMKKREKYFAEKKDLNEHLGYMLKGFVSRYGIDHKALKEMLPYIKGRPLTKEYIIPALEKGTPLKLVAELIKRDLQLEYKTGITFMPYKPGDEAPYIEKLIELMPKIIEYLKSEDGMKLEKT